MREGTQIRSQNAQSKRWYANPISYRVAHALRLDNSTVCDIKLKLNTNTHQSEQVSPYLYKRIKCCTKSNPLTCTEVRAPGERGPRGLSHSPGFQGGHLGTESNHREHVRSLLSSHFLHEATTQCRQHNGSSAKQVDLEMFSSSVHWVFVCYRFHFFRHLRFCSSH